MYAYGDIDRAGARRRPVPRTHATEGNRVCTQSSDGRGCRRTGRCRGARGDDVRERPGAHRRRLGQHQDGGHLAARQALAAVARDHRRAGLDRAREPVGPDELLRLLQRRPDAAGARRRAGTRAQRRGDEERARQEHLPRRQGPARRRPEVRLRHALPLSGPRARHGQRRLHHAHQPRRRRGAPRDEARRDRGRRHDTGAGDRRLDLGSVRAAPALHDRGRRRGRRRRGARSTTRRRSRSSGACSARAATRASRTTSTATSTSSRTAAARPARSTRTPSSRTASSSASCRRPDQPRQGRQAAGAAGRVARAPRRRSSSTTAGRRRHPLGGHQGPAHLRPRLQDDCGSRSTTPPRTAQRRSTPTRRPRRPAATPFKRPENGQFEPGTGLPQVLLRRDG